MAFGMLSWRGFGSSIALLQSLQCRQQYTSAPEAKKIPVTISVLSDGDTDTGCVAVDRS